MAAGRIAALAAAVILIVLAGTAATHAIKSDRAISAYPPPGRLVDIGDRKRLHLRCAGRGSPTVVLEAGMSGWSADWSRVQPAVARVTRACAYDRAGYGWSDELAVPRDSVSTARLLRRLLEAAGEGPPFLLAGHSLGGLHAQAFARLYPADTAAVVLVDSVHRRQSAAMPPKMRETYEGRLSRLTRASALLAPTGLLRLARQPASIVAHRLPVNERGAAEAVSYASKSYRALDTEMRAFRASQAGVDGPVRVPSVVITAGELRDYPPGFGPAEKRVFDSLQRSQADLKTSRTIHAARSGHYVHLDEPEVVTRAIIALVGESRRGAARASSRSPASPTRRG